MQLRCSLIVLVLLQCSVLLPQQPHLQSGPMLGYADLREVALWVQATAPATVSVRYWQAGNPAAVLQTPVCSTAEANTAVFYISGLEPGTRYEYKVSINGEELSTPYPTGFTTQQLWQWRKDPPDFSFATGSCAFINEAAYDRPGTPYGGEYTIFTAIPPKKPDFMLWLGDNIYLREVDWNTKAGVYHRYTHTRSLPEMQELLAAQPNYAIWDDHDFGPNDADRSFIHKDITLEAFKTFWPNPSFGLPGLPGITTSFQWSDAEFFLLDDRYFRTPDYRQGPERVMLGREQREWLIDALVNSKARFKFIVNGGQMLNPSVKYETFSMFPEEKAWVLEQIAAHNIKGVVFISGDIHSSEVTKFSRPGTYPLYDITVSPLTSGVHKGSKDENPLRFGEPVKARNFAVFSFTGSKESRRFTCIFYNSSGEEIGRISVAATELE